MRSIGYTGLAILLFLLSTPALAQPGESPSSPPGPVTIGGTIGVGTGGHATGVAVGVNTAVDLNRHLGLQFDAVGLDRGRSSWAFAGTVDLLVHLPGTARVRPFLRGGGGVYHLRFDAGPSPHSAGAVGAGPYLRVMAPAAPVPAAAYTALDVPAFYARRLRLMDHSTNVVWPSQTFTDPAVSLGGGLELDLSPRLALRPDVRALIVMDGRNRHTVTQIAVGFAYRF